MFLSWGLSREGQHMWNAQASFGTIIKVSWYCIVFDCMVFPRIEVALLMEWVPYFLGHPGYFCVSLFSCATMMQLCGYNFAWVSGYLHGSGREELWPTSKGCSGFAPWSFLRLVFTSLPLWVFLHAGLRGSVRAPWCHPGPSTWVNPVTSLGQENIRAFKPSGNWWMDFLKYHIST